MTAPLTHILPLTLIRRTRLLPAPGRVSARVGQKVNATDVVAETRLAGAHQIIDVRRALSLSQSDQPERFLSCRAGDRLQKGDVIAEGGGLFSRLVRAPENCRVVYIFNGQVLLEMESQSHQLLAGINGVVTEIIPDQGVVVETSGALIQGVWGNNHIDQGLLLVMVKEPLEEVNRGTLDVSMRGAVVFGSHVSSADAILAAGELPLRGLILGSMSAEARLAAETSQVPIMLLEGFGQLPINSAAFKLLNTSERRDACINTTWDPVIGVRPELVIPLPAEGQMHHDIVALAPEQRVRVISAPHASQVGKVVKLSAGITQLQNGVRTPTADILLEGGSEPVSIPIANLDVLE